MQGKQGSCIYQNNWTTKSEEGGGILPILRNYIGNEIYKCFCRGYVELAGPMIAFLCGWRQTVLSGAMTETSV